MECSGRTQLSEPEPQRIDFGQGKRAHDFGDHLGQHVERRAAGLLDDRDVEVALLVGLHFGFIDRLQPGGFQEAGDGAFRRADARAFLLFLDVGLLCRHAVHGQRQPARRGEGLGAFVDQPRRHQPVGDRFTQVLGRARLHACRDFFGEQFEQKIGHQAAPPPSVASHAAPQALASSRTRRM